MATKASVMNVDFSNVKDAGLFNPKQVTAGDYLAQITAVVDGKAKSDDGFQYIFTFKLKAYSQNSYPYYCKLTENQLWKLRNLLIAAGMNVPKARTKVDPGRIVGKWVGVTMEDDEYEGKMKSTIAAVFPASDLDETNSSDNEEDETDEEYEEPEVEETEEAEEVEEEETEEGDQFDSMDRTELKVFIHKLDSSFAFRKSQTDDDLREKARELSTSGDDELEELEIDDI